MRLPISLIFFMACLPLNGFSSEKFSSLLEKIDKQLKISGIEKFQSMKIENTESDVVVEVDISTASIPTGACITKTAQFIFSDDGVDHVYEDQLWLGECLLESKANGVKITANTRLDALEKLMRDTRNIFLKGGDPALVKYSVENKAILKHKGKSSEIIFISTNSSKDRTILNFAILVDEKKIFLEAADAPKDGPYEGTISFWNPGFDFKN